MISLTNINSCFEKFCSHMSDYIGVLYMNIFNDLPQAYRIYFDDNMKLQYNSVINDFDYRKKVINKLNCRKLLENAKNENNEYVSVFCYSSHEWLIVSRYDQVHYMINVTLGDYTDDSSYYETVYTNDIEKSMEDIQHWCEKSDKKEKIEFGIAAIDVSNALYTSWYEYDVKDIDIKKNYNDDIPYEKICELIENEGKSELMLFYGDPGTGKSSIIKHLIAKYPTIDFVFIDGALLVNASQDKLMSYFLENQNTVFILEDCEKALLDREHNYNPVMSILLNLTDGIISDVLGIKIICTFNTALNKIDKALLRKGRLSLKYEFKKLAKEKVRKILNDESINEDMTLADIYNIDDENDFSKKNTKKIGF